MRYFEELNSGRRKIANKQKIANPLKIRQSPLHFPSNIDNKQSYFRLVSDQITIINQLIRIIKVLLPTLSVQTMNDSACKQKIHKRSSAICILSVKQGHGRDEIYQIK